MQSLKTGLAILILFSYSLGLAHSLLPHCHVEFAESFLVSSPGEAHHHHQHFEHNDLQKVDHSHIVHQTHLDDGLFDFMVCLLSELEHPGSNDQWCESKPENFQIINGQFKLTQQLTALLTTFWVEIHKPEASSFSGSTFTFNYLSPIPGSSPERGPPSFFC